MSTRPTLVCAAVCTAAVAAKMSGIKYNASFFMLSPRRSCISVLPLREKLLPIERRIAPASLRQEMLHEGEELNSVLLHLRFGVFVELLFLGFVILFHQMHVLLGEF